MQKSKGNQNIQEAGGTLRASLPASLGIAGWGGGRSLLILAL